MGVREGPVYKDILDHLKEAKIDMNLKTKDDEANFIKDYISKNKIIVDENHINKKTIGEHG